MHDLKKKHFFALALGVAAIGLSVVSEAMAQTAEERPRNRFEHDILRDTFGYDESSPSEVEFEHMYQGCPARDCIPSIDDPKYVSVEQAADFLGDSVTASDQKAANLTGSALLLVRLIQLPPRHGADLNRQPDARYRTG